MILLARHGETEFNVARRAQGLVDSPLTALGVRQAHAMARLVADLVEREPGAWRMVSSPLGRAVATARIFSERTGLPFVIDERIREHSMGSFDGLHSAEFVPKFRMDVAPRLRPFHTPDGESFDAVVTRVRDFLDSIPNDHRVIVVSHGTCGRFIRGVYAGLEPEALLSQDVPQDAIFRLHAGQIDRFECEPLD